MFEGPERALESLNQGLTRSLNSGLNSGLNEGQTLRLVASRPSNQTAA
jgi:hypothetical protein